MKISGRQKISKIRLFVFLFLLICTIALIHPALKSGRQLRYILDQEENGRYTQIIRKAGEELGDPEAADMYIYLNNKNAFYPENNGIVSAANLAEKYPQNEFFQFELVELCLSGKPEVLDNKALLELSHRLETLCPENAFYRFVRAGVLLTIDRYRNYDAAMEIFSEIEKQPVYYYPYSKYKERLTDVAEAIYRLYGVVSQEIAPRAPTYNSDITFLSDLKYVVPEKVYSLIDEGRNEYAMNSADILSKIGTLIVKDSETLIGRMTGFTMQSLACELKLAIPEISPKESNAARHELYDVYVNSQKTREFSDKSSVDPLTFYIPFIFLSVLAIIISPLIASMILFAVGFLICLRRQKSAEVDFSTYDKIVSVFAYLYFYAIYLFVFCAVFIDCFEIEMHFSVLCWLIIAILLLIWLIGSLMNRFKPYRLKNLKDKILIKLLISLGISLLLCIAAWIKNISLQERIYIFSITAVILWLLIVLGWAIVRLIFRPWLFHNRFFQVTSVTVVTVAIAVLCVHQTVNKIVFMLTFFILNLAINLIITCRGNLFNKFRDQLSKKEALFTTLHKIKYAQKNYMLTFWGIGLVLFVLFLYHFDFSNIEMKFDVPELANVSKTQYTEMVKKVKNKKFHKNYNFTFAMLSPSDFAEMLRSDNFPGLKMNNKVLGDLIRGRYLGFYDIIVKALEEPQDVEILIARAETGDRTVLEDLMKLEREAWNELILHNTNYNSGMYLSNYLDIIAALSYISDPNTVLDKYLEVLEKIDLYYRSDKWFMDPSRKFLQSIMPLEKTAGSKVLTTYLNKTEYSDFKTGNDAEKTIDTLEKFATPVIAKKILTIVMSVQQETKPNDINFIGNFSDEFINHMNSPHPITIKLLKAITPHFDGSCIGLLKQALESPDGEVRAFMVKQLNRLGYDWQQSEIEHLTNDPAWQVRLNSLYITIVDEQTLANDENALIRLFVKHMDQDTES
ncbi:Phosphoglycerol transferase, alkaline phosphatase superfamily [Limihaloglobus sulfuriphilus]|uniref:Phosphoglycerol transferase, alkaline phosphatase superfamily n=1 Tax=Limihaloglobus sulfuriphilus TaxID=1851148 RepID=A0A1Q2MDN6_9BACT|nr:hypothetical protein [Limihaloglobus sulfuriphilus]AQQ70658.1 Phosphoglycerol transferase, alkaline phosphatase superfamily [Limihaloglobus sulfuriphilus]